MRTENLISIIKKLFIAVTICSLAFCHSHSKLTDTSAYSVSAFRQQLNEGNYAKAVYNIQHNKFYANKHNQILLNLELGKTLHLQQKYDSSNYYFNEADLLMEDHQKLSSYKGGNIDKILIHYYMALNYLYLNKNEDALVEAKRVNLRLNIMSDKNSLKNKIDPFAQILQGILYERMGDYDNAFIAYRDAFQLYEKHGYNGYLGVNIPDQLIADLINAANKAGNVSERDFYCQKLNVSFEAIKDTAKNKLLFFWENGIAPVKKEQYLSFRLTKTPGNIPLFFSDKENITIPITISPENKADLLGSNIKSINVSYAALVEPISYYNRLAIQTNTITYNPVIIENISHMMQINPLTLGELKSYINNNIEGELKRRRTERAVSKKIAEEALVKKKSEIEIAKKKSEEELAKLKSEDEKAAKVKEMELAQKQADQAIAKLKKEIASPTIRSNSSTLSLSYSSAGDTRSWQGSPSTICYLKVPVSKADKKIIVTMNTADGNKHSDTLSLNIKQPLSVINYITIKHYPCDINAFVPIKP